MVERARMAVPDFATLRVFAVFAHRRCPPFRMVSFSTLTCASSQLVSDSICMSDVARATSLRYPLPAPGAPRPLALW